MEIEQSTRRQIVRNILLSLFIYALPLLLMFATFYITGERPWEKKQAAKKETKATAKQISPKYDLD